MIRPDFNPADEPHAVADLAYAELVAMIAAVSDPDTGDEVMSYYIGIIDCSLPGASVAELIFWPNESSYQRAGDHEMFDSVVPAYSFVIATVPGY